MGTEQKVAVEREVFALFHPALTREAFMFTDFTPADLVAILNSINVPVCFTVLVAGLKHGRLAR